MLNSGLQILWFKKQQTGIVETRKKHFALSTIPELYFYREYYGRFHFSRCSYRNVELRSNELSQMVE